MASIATIARALLLSLCRMLAAVSVHAQSDSPCNQGRAISPAVDPRNEQAICFPELGRMIGTIGQCRSASTGEEYGNRIAGLGKLTDSGLACWVVSHQRCDTAIGVGSTGRYPLELLLYRGVRGGLPSVESGERIGPSEIGSITTYLASGDWDGDGNRDIATRIQLYNDTTDGGKGYDISRLVVFWGHTDGAFSLGDTTQLSPDGTLWLGIGPAVTADFDGDGVEDLCIGNTSSFVNGVVTPQAHLRLFRGHQTIRWGQSNITRVADWQWWGAPNYQTLAALDQDGDGVMDIVLYHNTSAGTGSLTVLYGRKKGGLPDPAEAETTDLLYANGHYALFSDVTGDGIPELLASCGSEEKIKVFIGLRGQRLTEQYGDGHEPGHPDQPRWWGRPWAELWQPHEINANWFAAEHPLYDLGDGNLDGVNDIWCVSWPYLLCYSGGKMLDSLIDGIEDMRPGGTVISAARLGDIDGSGRQAVGLSYDVAHGGTSSFPGGIVYITPSPTIPTAGTPRTLPDGTGKPTVGIEHAPEIMPTGTRPRVLPNPVRGELRVQWDGQLRGVSAITLTDVRGVTAFHASMPAGTYTMTIATKGIAAGEYFLNLVTSDASVTTTVVIR